MDLNYVKIYSVRIPIQIKLLRKSHSYVIFCPLPLVLEECKDCTKSYNIIVSPIEIFYFIATLNLVVQQMY